MSDLIERLRHADIHSQQRVLGSRIFGEAADRITALEKENAELLKALEPFANSDMAPEIYDDDSCVAGSCDFTCADLRRARTALRDAGGQSNDRP